MIYSKPPMKQSWKNAPVRDFECVVCGGLFSAKREAKYCSSNCHDRARYARRGQPSSEKRKKWYRNRVKKPEYLKRLRSQGRRRHRVVQKFIRAYKTKAGCFDCGYKKHHVALDFDHVYGSKKLNVCNAKSIAQAEKEIKKCVVRCSNCHRVKTYRRLQRKGTKVSE